jgi:hypothetical protein
MKTAIAATKCFPPSVIQYDEVSFQQQQRHFAVLLNAFYEKMKRQKKDPWTQARIAYEYNEIAKRDFPLNAITPMKREYVNDFIQIGKNGTNGALPRRSMHKLETPAEWKVWATLIRTSPEVLWGSGSSSHSNPAENARHAEALLSAMARCGQDMERLTGWAVFLPCSLVPEAFMTGHHDGLYPGKPYVQEHWNNIGKKRRNDLLAQGTRRKWLFQHLMFRSDLERIARGTDEFRRIPVEVRRQCFGDLIEKVEDSRWKIQLFVAENNPDLRKLVFGYDSILTIDDQLLVLRDFSGISYYSEKPLDVYPKLGVLKHFIRVAEFRTVPGVVNLLKDIARNVSETA